MALAGLVDKIYPRARWPTGAQIRGYGAWGPAVGLTLMYVIQPFDWIKATFGLNKEAGEAQ
ncbi:hypothetical protein HT031_004137 [Scenedesmus sp. PABB004]|nr:hypothetical protein HT031_004137 [Scenedesmus sp. PABB004]